jgi:hypothetical protein
MPFEQARMGSGGAASLRTGQSIQPPVLVTRAHALRSGRKTSWPTRQRLPSCYKAAWGDIELRRVVGERIPALRSKRHGDQPHPDGEPSYVALQELRWL